MAEMSDAVKFYCSHCYKLQLAPVEEGLLEGQQVEVNNWGTARQATILDGVELECAYCDGLTGIMALLPAKVRLMGVRLGEELEDEDADS